MTEPQSNRQLPLAAIVTMVAMHGFDGCLRWRIGEYVEENHFQPRALNGGRARPLNEGRKWLVTSQRITVMRVTSICHRDIALSTIGGGDENIYPVTPTSLN